MTERVAGLCVAGQHEPDADHLLLALAAALRAAGAAEPTLMTHFVPVDGVRVLACSVRADLPAATLRRLVHEAVGARGAWCVDAREHGPAHLLVAAGGAAAAAQFRLSGRAVVFPGCDGLTGTLGVADVLAGSAVARVTVVGRGTARPEERVDTRGYVRALLDHGELVLPTRPAADELLIPAEFAHPTPCCAAHG